MPTTTHTVEVTLLDGGKAEKVHSRVFATSDPNAVLKSVYLSRPQSNNYKRAKITVEFLD